MPSFLINNGKVKSPEKVSDPFSSFFLTIAESLKIHQVGKEDAISCLTGSFLSKFPGIKSILTTETEIRSIIHSLK
jgi:hypothetical protein